MVNSSRSCVDVLVGSDGCEYCEIQELSSAVCQCSI